MPKPYAEERGKGEYPWRARWPLPLGPDKIQRWGGAPGFRTKDDALEHAYEQVLAIKGGTWVDPRKSATPFGEYADRWLATHKRSLSTDDNRRYLLTAVLGPRWSETELRDITWDEVKEWANSLAIPRNTVDHSLTLMSTMLTSAVDAKMLNGNPLAGRKRHTGVKKPANLAPKTVAWCSAQQSAAIAARMTTVNGLMQIFQTFMGPRINEQLALHRKTSFADWADVIDGKKWTRRMMLVGEDDGSLEEVEVQEEDDDGNVRTKRKLAPAAPKNRFSVRAVDIPQFLVDLLDAYLATWPHDIVFSTSTGEYRHYTNVDKVLKKAAGGWPASERRRGTAGREAAEPIVPGLATQGNRHGHATMMADMGLPEVLRRAILGQKMPGMAGVYEHPTAAMRKRRVDLLEELWWREDVSGVYLAGPNALQIDRRKS